MSSRFSIMRLNMAGFFLFSGLILSLVLVLIAFGAGSDPESDPENGPEDVILNLQQAVDEAWEVYHDAALSGTLPSPEAQLSIEEGLRQSRMLLISAREGVMGGDREALKALEKKILKLTQMIIRTSRAGEFGQGGSGSEFLNELRNSGRTEKLGETIKTKTAILKDPAPMVSVPEGPFLMGSPEGVGRPDEQIQRSFFIPTFQIDKYEVTNRQFLTFIKETGRNPPRSPYHDGFLNDKEPIQDLPVVNVSWMDAFDYCHWAGKRLPSEAEWEKAARGPGGDIFPWGSSPPDSGKANFGQKWRGEKTLKPVGSFPDGGSFYGAMDMAGNVREWVAEWYDPDYFQIAASSDPRGRKKGISKVIRGGSWHHGPNSLRTAARDRGGFALKTQGIGFRCARSMEKE